MASGSLSCMRGGFQVMITFSDEASGRRLVLPPPALAHFARFRQLRCWHREAGGQIFSRLAGPDVSIDRVTGPRRTDRRGRHSYIPDRNAEQREIQDLYAEGMHFVGDWHTHPQPLPSPSITDVASIEDCVRRSGWTAYGFFLVIVGTAPDPDGLYVSFHNGTVTHRLRPVDTEVSIG